jgi:hypothetical protein
LIKMRGQESRLEFGEFEDLFLAGDARADEVS